MKEEEEDALKAYHDSQNGGAHLATKRVYEAMILTYYRGKTYSISTTMFSPVTDAKESRPETKITKLL